MKTHSTPSQAKSTDSPAPRHSGSSPDGLDPFQLPHPTLTDPSLQAGFWDGADESTFDARRAELIEGYGEANRMKIAMADTRLSPTARLINGFLAANGWTGRHSRRLLAALVGIDPRNVSRYLKEIKQKTRTRVFRKKHSDGYADFQFVFSGLDVVEIEKRRAEDFRKPPRQSDVQAPEPPHQSDVLPEHQTDVQEGQNIRLMFRDEVSRHQIDVLQLGQNINLMHMTSLVTDMTDLQIHENQSVTLVTRARVKNGRSGTFLSLLPTPMPRPFPIFSRLPPWPAGMSAGWPPPARNCRKPTLSREHR